MRRIERLSESVINRIAAGEVVQRPSAALKELLENSIDAGSTSVQIVVRDGGLELLQITDDGHGIHRDDLPLLCERYATSKLRAFEDLSAIHSFGFRGEALSSISYVARVTVTTMRRTEANGTAPLAWRCHFVDGVMQGDPQPCAGNPGTTIRVEKMFYNATVRRRALSRPAEEYGRMVSVVARYAMAFPRLAFACRREDGGAGGALHAMHPSSSGGGGRAELFFPKESTTLANIRLFYGSAIASQLHALQCAGGGVEDDGPEAVLAAPAETDGCFYLTGFTSGATLTNRKTQLCLFANNRLVESCSIRRALDVVYSGILTGGNKPFTVLFITVPPGRIDVNIHPTKHEVALLDEETIIAHLSEAVRRVLVESIARRQLDTRHVLAKAVSIGERGGAGMGSGSGFSNSGVVVPPSTMVRVEPQRGALDAFVRTSTTLPKVESALVESAPCVSSATTTTPITSACHTTRIATNSTHINNNTPARCTASQGGISASESNTHNEINAAAEEKGMSNRKRSAEPFDVTAILPTSRLGVPDSSNPASHEGRVGGGVTDNERDNIGYMKSINNNNEDDADADDDDDDGTKDDIMADFKRHRVELRSAVEPPASVPLSPSAAVKSIGEKEAGGSPPVEITEGHEDLLLTSVATIVSALRQATTPTASTLFEKLTFVGVLTPRFFLAQSGTSLYAVDTLRLLRCVVYQRIFFRWALASLPAAPQLVLQSPLRVADLLRFAAENDAIPSTPISLLPLERRLRHWREMLHEYFAIEITEDGHLVALPLGLNASWPPSPRVVPLFVWKLAAEVPYGEDEVACFTAIAQHIADTLYGTRLQETWMEETTGMGTKTNTLESKEEGEAMPSYSDAIRFGLVPCVTSAKFFAPPADILVDGTIQSIVSVEELYKVFERC